MNDFKMNELQTKIYNIIDIYGGSATRPIICEELFDSPTKYRTNVYEALIKMMKAGIVKRQSVEVKYRKRGRPEIEWVILEVD